MVLSHAEVEKLAERLEEMQELYAAAFSAGTDQQIPDYFQYAAMYIPVRHAASLLYCCRRCRC